MVDFDRPIEDQQNGTRKLRSLKTFLTSCSFDLPQGGISFEGANLGLTIFI